MTIKPAILNLNGKDIDKNATSLLNVGPKSMHIWK